MCLKRQELGPAEAMAAHTQHLQQIQAVWAAKCQLEQAQPQNSAVQLCQSTAGHQGSSPGLSWMLLGHGAAEQSPEGLSFAAVTQGPAPSHPGPADPVG